MSVVRCPLPVARCPLPVARCNSGRYAITEPGLCHDEPRVVAVTSNYLAVSNEFPGGGHYSGGQEDLDGVADDERRHALLDTGGEIP